MEQEIKSNFPNAKIELIKGNGGIFDVYLDERLLFSKNALSVPRFPEDGEIIRLIENAGN